MLRTFQLARLDYNIATYKHVMPCWRNELLTQKGVIRSKVIKGTFTITILPVEERKAKVLSRPLLVLNNNYSDYSLDFCVLSNGVIIRSLGKPTSGY